MWEPVDGEGISGVVCGREVTFVASVVVEGRANIPAFDAVWCKRGSLVGCFVDEDFCAKGRKWFAVEVVGSKHGCPGG